MFRPLPQETGLDFQPHAPIANKAKRMKPTALITQNNKGGVRKSTTLAMIFWTLRESNIEPIVVALDANTAFLDMITVEGQLKPEVYTWDLNNVGDTRAMLPDLVSLSTSTGRPLLFDLPAKAGVTLGVKTLLRSGALRHLNLVGIASTIQTELSMGGTVEAHEIINPAKWALVEYGKRTVPSCRITEAMDALKPDDTIRLEELDPSEANQLAKTPPVPYSELLHYVDSGGLSASCWFVVSEFWRDCHPKLSGSLRKIAPELFASKEPVPAEPEMESNLQKTAKS